MADLACLVCGHAGLKPCLEILLKCPNCGFVTASLDAPEKVRRLYEGDYFTGGEYRDYRDDEAFFKRNFRRRLKQLRRRCAGGRLLEIGAAYGFFLDLARMHFNVIGFEVNAEAARHARDAFGADVRTEDFLGASLSDIGGPVDVTVMWDVLEHLERPDRYLEHVRVLSKPGALLYITTGDIGSCVARLRGRKWRMIHPPSHLHYFTRSTLSRLLANHGFHVIETRSIGVARSLRQILYSILVLQLGMKRVYKATEAIVPASWGFTLNMFDIMQVTAQRET